MQQFKNISICLVLCLAFTFSSAVQGFAQEIKIRAQIEADSILIGDQIRYLLELEQPAGLSIEFPVLGDTLVPGIEILSQSNPDTQVLEENRLYINQSILITSFDSGFYTIPGQAFSVQSASGEERAFTNPLGLQVLTMELDTTNAIFDIKMPYRAPIKISDLLPYFLIVLVAVLLVLLIIRFIKNRKRKKQGFVLSKPTEPAHIIALRSLDHLKEEKLWQNNKVKLYYIRLTEIIRVYLEHRYSIKAMEETTSEILEDLSRAGFNDNRLYTKIKSLLDLADLAKFAKQKPLPSENESCLLDAYIFVNETKISEQLPKELDPDEEVENEEPDTVKDIKDE